MGNYKFRPGDLVVLKRKARYRRYPDSIYDKDLSPELYDAIIGRESVRYVSYTSSRDAVRAFTLGDTIPEGTLGIVKGYENVFMLDSTRISLVDRVTPLSLHDLRHNVVKVENSKFKGLGFLNNEKVKHLQVLIDGRLVAFLAGGTLFEPAEAVLARHKEVILSFQVDVTVKNVDEAGINEAASSLLARLDRIGTSRMVGYDVVEPAPSIDSVPES